jgi:hypothetical protein
MGSLAKSLSTEPKQDPATRIQLTMPGGLQPLSSRDGVWSQGPIYKQLDAAFLQRPLIPRAPPTPRLTIDRINGSLRVIDPVHSPAFSDIPNTLSSPLQARHHEPKATGKARLQFQLLAIFAGVAAGLAAALLLGWL